MSIFRKDGAGNVRKIAGYLVQRWNNALFNTTHSYDGTGLIEYYDIDPAANAFITGLVDFTEFSLMIWTPNTTDNVYIRFGGKTLKLERSDGVDLAPGELNKRLSVYTLQASVDNTIWKDAVSDYLALINKPEINTVVIQGKQTGRHYLLPDLAMAGYDTPLPGDDIDYDTSTVETVKGILKDYAKTELEEDTTDDKGNDFLNTDRMTYGDQDSVVIIKSDKAPPMWESAGTNYRLATEAYVDMRTAGDIYMGMFEWAINTWANIDEATIGDRAIALDTNWVYVCTASYIPEVPESSPGAGDDVPAVPAVWEREVNPLWVDDGSQTDPDTAGESRYIVVDADNGEYWDIEQFVDENGLPGTVTWNGTTSAWDIFIDRSYLPDEDTIVTNYTTRRFSVAKLPHILTLGYKNIGDTVINPLTAEDFDATENIEFAIQPSSDDFNMLTIGTDGKLMVSPGLIVDDGGPDDVDMDSIFDDGTVV